MRALPQIATPALASLGGRPLDHRALASNELLTKLSCIVKFSPPGTRSSLAVADGRICRDCFLHLVLEVEDECTLE